MKPHIFLFAKVIVHRTTTTFFLLLGLLLNFHSAFSDTYGVNFYGTYYSSGSTIVLDCYSYPGLSFTTGYANNSNVWQGTLLSQVWQNTVPSGWSVSGSSGCGSGIGQWCSTWNFATSFSGGGTLTFKVNVGQSGQTELITLNIVRPTTSSASITGTNPICSGSQTYTLNSPPSGVSWAWSTSSNLAISGSTSNTTASVYATGGGPGFVKANWTQQGCPIEKSLNLQVGVYTPSQMAISGQTSLCVNQQYAYYCPFLSSNSSDYSWQVSPSSSFSYYSSSNAFFLTPNSPGYSTVMVRVQNACGWPSNPATYNISQSSCYGFRFSSSPNPTTNQLAVAATVVDEKGNEIERKATDTYPEFSYKLLNEQGVTLLEGASDKLNALLDLKKLPKGIYYLHLNDGKTITKQRIGKE